MALNDKNDTHYFLDINPDEAERLQLGELVIGDWMEGKRVWAPLDLSQPGLKILDSATASGVWLKNLQASIPNGFGNTYIGTDVSPIYFMQNPPQGISLSVHSMKEPWPAEWQSSFDLVHQRMALPAAGLAVVKQVIANMIGLLKPGGWLQLVESDHSIVEGPAMGDMFRLLCDVFNVMETGPDYATQLEDWFRELGLVDVGSKIFDIALGARHPKEELKAKSTRCFVLGLTGVTQAAKGAPSSFTAEELDQVVPNVERELTEQGGVHRLHCVWGMKPYHP